MCISAPPQQAGSLLVAFGEAACPLCGAMPEHHRLNEDCDGNVDAVVSAARAEAAKIELRQTELKETVATLQREAKGFERRIPRIEADLHRISQEIETIVAPRLRRLRTAYGELADKKGKVREALSLYNTLKDLEDRRMKLLAEEDADSPTNAADIGLSTSTVDKFAAMPWTGQVVAFFGRADRYDQHGFYGPCAKYRGRPLPAPCDRRGDSRH